MTPDEMKTRRALLARSVMPVTAIALGAIPKGANSQTTTGTQTTLNIKRRITFSLNSPEVFEFAGLPTTSHRLKGPLPDAPETFAYLSQTHIDKPEPITIVGAIERRYLLIRNNRGGPGEPMSAVVPVRQPALLYIVAHVFVRTDLPDAKKQAISDAFAKYDFSRHGAPEAYAGPLMAAAGVTPADFLILPSWELERAPDTATDKRTLIEDADVALRALYSSSNPSNPPLFRGTTIRDSFYLLPGTGPIKAYDGPRKLERNPKTTKPFAVSSGTASGYSLRPNGEQVLRALPSSMTVDNPLAKTDASELAANVEKQVTADLRAAECAGAVKIRYVPLMVLVSWPEFKTEMVRQTIKIGCVTAVVELPQFFTRTTTQTVNGYYPEAGNIADAAKNIITECLVVSATGAAIAGLILSEFATALKVFRLLFDSCVEYKKALFITCVIPGLAILTETSEWH